MSWQKIDGRVVITLTEEEYSQLLLLLGFASAEAIHGAGLDPTPIFRLMNTINAGNPKWTPYGDKGVAS